MAIQSIGGQPNVIGATKTWVSKTPGGQRANGTIHFGVGVNTKYGIIGITGRKFYESHIYQDKSKGEFL